MMQLAKKGKIIILVHAGCRSISTSSSGIFARHVSLVDHSLDQSFQTVFHRSSSKLQSGWCLVPRASLTMKAPSEQTSAVGKAMQTVPIRRVSFHCSSALPPAMAAKGLINFSGLGFKVNVGESEPCIRGITSQSSLAVKFTISEVRIQLGLRV